MCCNGMDYTTLIIEGITVNIYQHTAYEKIKRKLQWRNMLWLLSFIFLIIALCNPHWGTKAVANYTQGDAVAFVFDISHSMNAMDISPTRLRSAAFLAQSFLTQFNETPVSLILAKGSAAIAIPLTYDYTVLYSMLNTLSPNMLSSTGSDIGSGIYAAIRSFPAQSASRSHIIIYTDGDETVENLEKAISDAAYYGISVSIIGFGTTDGIETRAGDNETTVITYLQEEKLQDIVSHIRSKNSKADISYYNAAHENLLSDILKTINGSGQNKNRLSTEYRAQSINHFALFSFLAVCFFILGVIVGEFKCRK